METDVGAPCEAEIRGKGMAYGDRNPETGNIAGGIMDEKERNPGNVLEGVRLD